MIETNATTQAVLGMPVCAQAYADVVPGALRIAATDWHALVLTGDVSAEPAAKGGFPSLDATRVRPTGVFAIDGTVPGPHVWSPPI